MINKLILQSFIDKYYLNGTNSQAKWRVKDNSLTVYAGRMGRVCKIVLDKFDFEDSELGVFDTQKLNKLISITQGDLVISPVKGRSDNIIKLAISDLNFDLTYSLADLIVMDKVSYYKDPDEYEVEIELNPEDIMNLVKAKNALQDEDNMVINTIEDENHEYVCEVLFGDNSGFSNKISYKLLGNIKDVNISLPFNSYIFKEILNSNKDMNGGKLRISKLGMMKLNFEKEGMSSEYFISRSE